MARATPLTHTQYDWYELVLDDIAQSSGPNQDEMRRMGKERLSFPKSFKYLHLGNPESIVIVPETPVRRGDGI